MVRNPRICRLYLAVLAAGLPAYFLSGGWVQRGLFYVYGFSSVAAVLIGTRLHRPTRKMPWLAFAAGLGLFALGDVVFDIYAAVGTTTPVPSVADVLYLAAYPLLAWGILGLVRAGGRDKEWASAIDGLIVAMGAGLVAWVWVMAPYSHDESLSLAAKVVLICYPAFDLLLVAVVVRLFLRGGDRNPAFWLLTVSVVTLLAADGFYAVAQVNDAYSDGSLIDLGWLMSYALWGAAALHPSMRRISHPRVVKAVGHRVAEAILLVLAALAAPVMLIVASSKGERSDIDLLAVASGVMFALVLARLGTTTHALDRSRHHLSRAVARQEALTAAAVALVGATDEVAIAVAAVSSGQALAGSPDSWAVLRPVGDADSTTGASSGTPPSNVGALLDNWDPVGCSVPCRLADLSTDRDTSPPAYAAGVTVDDQLWGVLVVGNIANGEDEFLPALALLASETSLALQTMRAAEESLRARNARKFELMVQHSSDVVTLLQADRRIVYQSPAVEVVLGRTADSLLGHHLGEIVHPDDLVPAQSKLMEVASGGIGTTTTLECRVAHADGHWRTVDAVITNLLDASEVGAIVVNSRDVTERRALEAELNRQAFHDTLTGLANRALFLDRVSHALERCERDTEPIAVLFLDLDDFKTVNDSLGHPAGDQLLVEVSQRLKAATRPSDTVARFGGDEFAILLESGAMPDTAQAVSRRIADALSPTFHVGGTDLLVRASIGITFGRHPQETPDDLLRDADLAMYLAKRNGKGRFEMYRPDMREDAVRFLETAADLRRGIEGGELEVFYQPIVNAHTSSTVGVEALVRWRHPDRGIVAPEEFIPVAEATGLIVPLGKQVLQAAAQQGQAWRSSEAVAPDFYVSVNLSARQLQDPNVVDDVKATLITTGLRPQALVLEVTESTLIENIGVAAERLRGLSKLGVRLAVDDFGTGYSSLSYLADLPVNVVKIDKSFVDRLTHDPQGAAMVRTVIDLARALGLTCIAEGVEHHSQLRALDLLGCDNVQGFLFSRPLPGPAITDRFNRLKADEPAVAAHCKTG